MQNTFQLAVHVCCCLQIFNLVVNMVVMGLGSMVISIMLCTVTYNEVLCFALHCVVL